jgi:hypothetical protein
MLELAQRICSWAQPPSAWLGGRTGWHELEPDLADSTGVRALKLKGLGQPPWDGPARPPADLFYDRWPGQPPDLHFGIGADLEFRLLPGDPAPVGGLFLVGAEREFDCASKLRASNVPSVAPIAVFEYEGRSSALENERRPLGISVTGSPVSTRGRCSAVLDLDTIESHDEVVRLATRLDVNLTGYSSQSRLLLLGEIYRRFGETLRAFSTTGWYRYSGHPGNIVIDEGGSAVLVDLDSCRECAPDRPDIAALEAVRDGMSALYNLACSFFTASSLDQIDDESLVANEPF